MKPNPTALEQMKTFMPLIMKPVAEWQREARTNKAFYLGQKEFYYIATLTGHEPVAKNPWINL